MKTPKQTKLGIEKVLVFPEENSDNDYEFHRELLVKIIFGLYAQQKERLEAKGWPPRPVHQKQIFQEYKKRIAEAQRLDKDLKLTGSDREWPSFAKQHDHNWIERRVNYLADERYGLRDSNGRLKVVVMKKEGYYSPNPELFK